MDPVKMAETIAARLARDFEDAQTPAQRIEIAKALKGYAQLIFGMRRNSADSELEDLEATRKLSEGMVRNAGRGSRLDGKRVPEKY